MSNLITSVFDTVTMTNYFRLECFPVRDMSFDRYFRIEVDPEVEELEEYVRLEVDDYGNVEEVIGLEVSEVEWEEVVGMELKVVERTEFEEVVGLEINLGGEENDYEVL
jgi:hypothetical protein